MKKVIAVLLISGLVFLFAGCKKKEEMPTLPPGHPSTEGGMPPTGTSEMPRVDRKVIVPKEVSAKWKAVKITVEDKIAKTNKEYTIRIGGEQTVAPKMSVKVLAFLPDFRMGAQDITSASAEPKNPAAQVSVTEGGKEIWKGWLYSLHPDVHPFKHDKIALALNGGVAK
jgi:hypothetical protein